MRTTNNKAVSRRNVGAQFISPGGWDSHKRSVPSLPNAFALDLFRFGVYTFPQRVAGAMSFHDPLEGTETKYKTYHINKYKK